MLQLSIHFSSTYSGGDPRKLNDVNTISTRCPGPAKKIYKHWREWFDGLFDRMLIIGAVNVPFCEPPGRETNVWSHSIWSWNKRKIWEYFDTMLQFSNWVIRARMNCYCFFIKSKFQRNKCDIFYGNQIDYQFYLFYFVANLRTMSSSSFQHN